MPSILFMNWELLSGALTDNIVKTSPTFLCGCERQLTCFDCGSLARSQNWYDEGGERKRESGVKFHCAQTSKKITFSTLFREQLSLLSPAQSHVGLILTAIPMKGTGLLLCKPWKWSSHTVCLCALPGLLPHPDVYSLTAHSYEASAFEVSAHSANMLMVSDDIKVKRRFLECRLSSTHIG